MFQSIEYRANFTPSAHGFYPWRSLGVYWPLAASTRTTVGAESVVQIRDNFFSPKQRNIAPNDSVRWVNQGNNPHTTTSNNGLWNSGTLNHGDAFSVTFSNVGSFPYFCQIDGQMMSGTINVTTNGSAVLSDLFLVTVSGSVRSTNALGKIVLTPERTKGKVVADCAGDHQLNPANLSLV